VAGPTTTCVRPPPLQRSSGIGRATSDQIKWLLTDDHGVTHAISIPPPLIPRQAIAEMRADAERLVAPQFRQIVRLIEEPILQPIYDLESPRMAFGRVRSWVTRHSWRGRTLRRSFQGGGRCSRIGGFAAK
jgi:hypothetical protein